MEVEMNSVRVTARPWSGGWELEIDSENVTQVRDLTDARQQVVDYLDTVEPDVDHGSLAISIRGLADGAAE